MKTEYRIITGEGRFTGAMGVWEEEGKLYASFASPASQCALLLYQKGTNQKKARLPFPEEGRTGHVWTMTVYGDFKDMEYAFEEDGRECPDPYGRAFKGHDRWGDKNNSKRPLRTPLGRQEAYDWEGDRPLELAFEDCIMYRIHPRGFTKHPSSGLGPKERGTFKGIASRIPYLKELGITTVEMMPPVEFQEILLPEQPEQAYAGEEPETGKMRLNYWGYAPAFSFAPKASYSSLGGESASREFKDMVKAFHRAGLEVVIELYLDGTRTPDYALELARFWVLEYHVDGIHLTGFWPLKMIGEDPYLGRTKLFAENWENVDPGQKRHLCEYNQGFMLDMRGFLKGDEGKLNQVIYHTRHNPETLGAVNYMAGANGFTMADMVSYDRKHNEDNGEENRDGTDYNQSWNCGAEGPTRKKKILAMRRRQLRNAMLFLFLSQGMPLLLAGDEFGRTQKGNNNAYCQDNEISWVNWSLLKTHKELYEFARCAIRFRREHSLFHLPKEPALMDYASVGMPDVSYHGVKAWYPEFDSFRRQLGIFYCGQYGKKPDGSPDDYFYVAYNMHWEPHEFALPHLPKGLIWHTAFDTYEDSCNGIYEAGREPVLEDQRRCMVMARSIMVLVGKSAPAKGKKSAIQEEEAHAETGA